jgi:hypothetical protein
VKISVITILAFLSSDSQVPGSRTDTVIRCTSLFVEGVCSNSPFSDLPTIRINGFEEKGKLEERRGGEWGGEKPR